jgi:hypothetical protein
MVRTTVRVEAGLRMPNLLDEPWEVLRPMPKHRQVMPAAGE